MTTPDIDTRREPPPSRQEIGAYWLAVMRNQLHPGTVEIPPHPDDPPRRLDIDGPF